MKKDLGSILALYPTPLTVVGAMVNGRPNWVLVGHVGIMGHDHIMVSLAKSHYTNQGIRDTRGAVREHGGRSHASQGGLCGLCQRQQDG